MIRPDQSNYYRPDFSSLLNQRQQASTITKVAIGAILLLATFSTESWMLGYVVGTAVLFTLWSYRNEISVCARYIFSNMSINNREARVFSPINNQRISQPRVVRGTGEDNLTQPQSRPSSSSSLSGRAVHGTGEANPTLLQSRPSSSSSLSGRAVHGTGEANPISNASYPPQLNQNISGHRRVPTPIPPNYGSAPQQDILQRLSGQINTPISTNNARAPHGNGEQTSFAPLPVHPPMFNIASTSTPLDQSTRFNPPPPRAQRRESGRSMSSWDPRSS